MGIICRSHLTFRIGGFSMAKKLIRWTIALTAAILLSAALAMAAKGKQATSPPTKALVVGTIHQAHETNRNYSYVDIVNILATYDPDLICVEIRPKDFRREPYLKEMMLATVWGLSHGKKVAPTDWWDDTQNDREIREKLATQPEYVAKDKQLQALRAQDEIITRYEKSYGTEERVWAAQLGYRFWNGKDYNEAMAEDYRLSMQVYGDSPINLHYLTRNNRMMDLIWNAIRENSSRRVVVLAGSEHKHFFDQEFKKHPEIETLDFDSIQPLKMDRLEPTMVRFLDDDDDLPYFEKGYPKDLNAYYANKLIIVHGPDMDVYPDTVPAVNIERAGRILGRWKSAGPESDRETFEWSWYKFLHQDYAGAVVLLRQLAERVDQGKVEDQFVRVDTYLNLGRSYDMLNDRKNALACYARVEKLIAGSPWESAKAYILQNYETVPFHHSKPN
jgi:tetratricopeptide (TPR) repeat protein